MSLQQIYFAPTGDYPDDLRIWWGVALCMNAVLALSGGYGLVLRRRRAKPTVYVTENGVHDPQTTGSDQ
jgi:hypothetical protein